MLPFDLLGLFVGLAYLLVPFFVLAAYRRLRALERRTEERLQMLEERTRVIEVSLSRVPQEPASIACERAAAADAVPASVASTPVMRATHTLAMSEEAWTAGAATAGQPGESDLYRRARAWLVGGNTVARVGVVVLFFGVAFFFKYAVERGWLPVELRLATAALGGFALCALGWRLRARQLGYGLVLQGGGVGVVYLSVYAAMALYGLLPPAAGLALMACLVALGAALAVLQDSRGLAVLAVLGGFLAPLLVPSGRSHVMLFGYYAVLDLGILGIAWFKAWRELNVLGFLCTFVIGAIWGQQFYQPLHFWSTEPFLLLFFLIYVTVPVLFAARQPPDLKGFVDGTLVFGVPLVAFGLQATLVRDTQYGLALSAVAAGLFYASLATVIWSRLGLRLLVEAFGAIAVVFGTVAIPLAVDGQWTAVAWAIEGAALVWLGVRQDRTLARYAGLLLQSFGAATALLAAPDSIGPATPVLNGVYLRALTIALAGGISAYVLKAARGGADAALSTLALGWGLAWWYGAGVHEILLHAARIDQPAALLGLVSFTSAATCWLRRRLDWPDLKHPPLLLLPAMVAIAALRLLAFPGAHLFTGWGLPAWAAAFLAQYWLLHRLEGEWPPDIVTLVHRVGLWLVVFVAGWELRWVVGQLVPTGLTWAYAAPAVVVASAVSVLPRLLSRPAWPFGRHPEAYGREGQLPLAAAVAAWTLHASWQPGDSTPLAYLPLLNPLELTQGFVVAVLAGWCYRERARGDSRWLDRGVAVVGFVALNGLIARAFHTYAGVPFELGALWASPGFQAVTSIVWTAAALALMVAATRLRERGAWVIGAALLGIVVAKLFAVDLSGLGTIARILSFVVVGLLMLLIGYLSPLPPRSAGEGAQ
jgi:uncharacterized membrane protein